MSAENVKENFYGVYLLLCVNPRYKGRTYIGYTVNPSRRIQQHNKGKQAGGAWKTSNRGPWEMVLIVHGFLEEISALRFEWAWQHPQRSRRLQSLPKKKSNENRFQYNFRVLSHMLNCGPWCKLPLTIQWLKPEYAIEFHPSLQPPNHMPIEYGQVLARKRETVPRSEAIVFQCFFCKSNSVDSQMAECLDPSCDSKSHLICLANHFLKGSNSVLPVEGSCPKCQQFYLWGDVIRKIKGCYGNRDVLVNNTLIE